MIRFSFLSEVYLQVTPSGAFYAVSSPEVAPARGLLLSIMAQETTPLLNSKSLNRWNMFGVGKPSELLWNIQEAGWVSGTETPLSINTEELDRVLPRLLHSLARDGMAFLADENGFVLSHGGFHPDVAQQLAAYSIHCLNLREQCAGQLKALELNLGAMAFVDAAGFSQLGFWPLYLGGHRFSLGISGTPFFDQIGFRDIIWNLTARYI